MEKEQQLVPVSGRSQFFSRPFRQIIKEKKKICELPMPERVFTIAGLALSPVIIIKLIALYESLIHTAASISAPNATLVMNITNVTLANCTSGTVPNQEAQQIALWALVGTAFTFFTIGNQIVTIRKYTPQMVRGIINDVLELVGKKVPDEPKIPWKRTKKTTDYTSLLAFSALHGAFAFVAAKEIFGSSPWAIFLESVIALALPLTLAPLRYAHGLASGHHHDHEHGHAHDHDHGHDLEDGHSPNQAPQLQYQPEQGQLVTEKTKLLDENPNKSCNRLLVLKIFGGVVLFVMNGSVYVFESLYVLRPILGLPLSHNLVVLLDTAIEHPVWTGFLGTVCAAGAVIETVAEVNHIGMTGDHAPIISPEDCCGRASMNGYAFASAMVSDHIEPFILFMALAIALELDLPWLVVLSVVGSLLTTVDSALTGPMHAYGFAFPLMLFQSCLLGPNDEDEHSQLEDIQPSKSTSGP